MRYCIPFLPESCSALPHAFDLLGAKLEHRAYTEGKRKVRIS